MSYTNGLDDPTQFFNTILYTGNGSTNAITGVGFQPDWVWCKNRTSAKYHGLYDSVRGTGTSKSLTSNSSEAEGANANFINLTSFDSDGFTLGATSNTNQINTSGENHVAWNWKAGGSASSNTDGSITSTVSANTTAGFSIVSYTGTGSNATIGHGLGSAPQVVIVKERSSSDSWHVGHASLGFTKNLYLNATNATNTETAIFNDTAPTSSVFSLGNNTGINASSSTYIVYCFAEKKGYSKFGSYTGNDNADGTFVYTGFAPAWVMIKRTNSVNDWIILDRKRNPRNPSDERLLANSSNAASTANTMVDFLSNGFKPRSTYGGINGASDNFIYMTFAESPFVNSNGIPNNAR